MCVCGQDLENENDNFNNHNHYWIWVVRVRRDIGGSKGERETIIIVTMQTAIIIIQYKVRVN